MPIYFYFTFLVITMFKRFFGGNLSDSKLTDGVNYFFAFSLNLLKKKGNGQLSLSESEKLEFRTKYINKTQIENYGVWFFSRIEIESTSFTNHHLSSGTTSKIRMCSDPNVDFDNIIVKEVESYLKKVL